MVSDLFRQCCFFFLVKIVCPTSKLLINPLTSIICWKKQGQVDKWLLLLLHSCHSPWQSAWLCSRTVWGFYYVGFELREPQSFKLCRSFVPTSRSDESLFSFVNAQTFEIKIFVWIRIPGEANFLGGVASVKGVKGFNPEAAKKRFFEIYLDKVIDP